MKLNIQIQLGYQVTIDINSIIIPSIVTVKKCVSIIKSIIRNGKNTFHHFQFQNVNLIGSNAISNTKRSNLIDLALYLKNLTTI